MAITVTLKGRISTKVDRIYRAKAELEWAVKLHELSVNEKRSTISALDSVNMIDASTAMLLRQGCDTDVRALINESWQSLRSIEILITHQLVRLQRHSCPVTPGADRTAMADSLHTANWIFLVHKLSDLVGFAPHLNSFCRATGGFESILGICVEVHRRLLQLSTAKSYESKHAYDFFGGMRKHLQTCLSTLEYESSSAESQSQPHSYQGDLRMLGRKLDASIDTMNSAGGQSNRYMSL
ncbi:MAG: hypothetical protein AAF662_08695 [Pseudomonadota bacterium]